MNKLFIILPNLTCFLEKKFVFHTCTPGIRNVESILGTKPNCYHFRTNISNSLRQLSLLSPFSGPPSTVRVALSHIPLGGGQFAERGARNGHGIV